MSVALSVILPCFSRARTGQPLCSPAGASTRWAERLHSFGGVTGDISQGGAVDATCEGARLALAGDVATVVVSADTGCGKLAEDAQAVSISVPRYRWPRIFDGDANSRVAYVTTNEPGLISARPSPAESNQ